MFNLAKNLISLFLFSFLFFSCTENITNDYTQPSNGGGSAPDINVIFSSYSLETIHSYHMDTTAYPEYNYVVNLNLKLDKPENRNQINKIIITNEYGMGWEFYSNELESFYSDTLGGYEINNLIYPRHSEYYSMLYKVKLFSVTNKQAEDYEFIIAQDFLSIPYMYHSWYTHDIYQLYLESYPNSFNFDGEVFWLNTQKQIIDIEDFQAEERVNGYLRYDNIPDNAYYFYVLFKGKKNGIEVMLKSAVYAIQERYPDNIQVLNEGIYEINIIKYIPQIREILIIDRSSNYVYFIDFENLNFNNKVQFNNRPNSITYSEYDNKIYVGCENGKLYSLDIPQATPTFVKNLGSGNIYGMIVIDKYLIASTSGNIIRIINLEDNSVTTVTNFSFDNFTNFVFNKTKKVVYGSNNNGYITRFNFEPTNGLISNSASRYYGSSNYNELLLYPDDSKLITSNGNIYNCSSDVQNDLTVFNTFEEDIACAYFSNDNSNIVALHRGYYSSDPTSISIYSKDNLEINGYIENFFSTPGYLIMEGDIIKVISTYNSRLTAELFSYSEIISGGKMLNKPVKEKFYLQKQVMDF